MGCENGNRFNKKKEVKIEIKQARAGTREKKWADLTSNACINVYTYICYVWVEKYHESLIVKSKMKKKRTSSDLYPRKRNSALY